MTIVRLATADDIPQIVAMGSRFYMKSRRAQRADYDPASAAAGAGFVLQNGYIYAAERDGELIGMLGMIVAPFLMNMSLRTATETMWWVEPDARGAGAILLRRTIAEARARECAWMSMSTLHDSPPEAAEILIAFGFRHEESTYTLEL